MEHDRQDALDYELCMEYVRAHAVGEVEGLCGPGSVSWMIFREPIALAGGIAAILLQMAHPAIAAGVTRFSNFRNDVLGRARRTITSLYEFEFGSFSQAMEASRRLHRIHQRVRGVVEEVGAPMAGMPYRANEQHLLRWVVLTVQIATLQAFQTFVRPLTREELRRFQREAILMRAVVGVLPSSVPEGEGALEAWYEEALQDPTLYVGETAKGIAHALFHSPLSLAPLDAIMTAALLPPRFREAYGLPWGRKEQLVSAAIVQAARGARALVRPPFRYVVAYHQAQLRIAQSRGERPGLYAAGLNLLDRYVDLPTSFHPIAPQAR